MNNDRLNELVREALPSLARPAGKSFAEWMASRCVLRSTRRYDWDALKFQADFKPEYGRAQMRYVGTGATGVAADGNTVPAVHFTFSTMKIPPGHIGPLHLHTDAEEIFFVLQGTVKLFCESLEGERWEAVVGPRDLISIPPGIYRGEENVGDDDALLCVMVGSPRPMTPTYRPDDPLSRIKR
ncbi:MULTISPECIES: cupin domain-containing protein [Chromobacterium]|uniref:cupin domain-containing protein n=1 Tax=Chromobacterium TaxID=535 RepID=UPI000D30FA10|nr:cupin domain-containing protein [Chromobacterium rhizoryzae]PTU65000.1 cupin domain-containing protein [Chromobacterium sp. Panama]UJB31299.1 cupin domain-containing protein [Chromobacterium sp. Beijing]